ncbi:MAG: hypothetical protein J5I53_06535, partial [Bradyrhizobiaceae bacterium]|nr:hypothetical protein [Bradyrhizobiaceae bacterium]
HHQESNKSLALTITSAVLPSSGTPGDNTGDSVQGQGAMVCVVSVQTSQGYLELHDVTGVLSIEPDEVLFIARHGDRFDSLVVGSRCTCSQFGNVRSSLLGTDFTTLDPAMLMAAMQLSLAEGIV